MQENGSSASCSFDVATYPRKGTETKETETLEGYSGCNLSPQGDGNSAVVTFILLPLLQLIPARGRKPLLNLLQCIRHLVATYPRKGTETTIPAHPAASPAPVATYPRKGTETCRWNCL